MFQTDKQSPKFTLLAESEGHFFVSPKIGSFDIEFTDNQLQFIDLGNIVTMIKIK